MSFVNRADTAQDQAARDKL